MCFFKFKNKDKEIENGDLNRESSIPLQNRFSDNQPMNDLKEENNLILIQRNEDIDRILQNPSRKESSYIRSNKKQTNEIAEKLALGELYNFIRYKFNNSTENDLEGNFQINLNIPYQVTI